MLQAVYNAAAADRDFLQNDPEGAPQPTAGSIFPEKRICLLISLLTCDGPIASSTRQLLVDLFRDHEDLRYTYVGV